MSEELLKAAIALRDDMIARAKANDPDDIVVEAGAGVWHRFNEAINASQPVEGLREAVAWMRSWNFKGNPCPVEFTDDAELADQWRGHPQTDKVTPLYTTPVSDIAAEGGRKLTLDRVADAMCNAVIRDDEGEYPRLFDLLGFSGENKARTVVRGLARAALEAITIPAGEEYSLDVLQLGHAWTHADAQALGYPSILKALEHLEELREAPPTAEAVREACAKKVESYSGIGVSPNDYLSEQVTAILATAIRAMPLPQAEAAKVEPVAWQPIETAPKMREVLLWADTSTPDFRNWKMASGYYHDGMNVWIWGGEPVRDWAFPPTHWMPLPPAPKGQSDE